MTDITLRPVSMDDFERLRGWRNSPHVSRFMYTDHVISAAEHELWLARVLQDPTCRHWVIEFDGVPVGAANLVGIDTRHLRCSYGLYIAEDVAGRGVGQCVMYRLIEHALVEIKLHKLSGEALAFNEAALRLYDTMGLTREGVLRRHIQKQGSYHDVVLFSILRDEWITIREMHRERLRHKGMEIK